MAILWTNNMSVGVEELDGQHKMLIRILNDLGDGMRTGQSRAVMSETIDNLINYAATHFASEELMFDKYNYGSAVTHKREHDTFVEKISAFRKDIAEGKAMISVQLFDFIWSWLKEHIMKVDKAYGPYLNGKGVK